MIDEATIATASVVIQIVLALLNIAFFVFLAVIVFLHLIKKVPISHKISVAAIAYAYPIALFLLFEVYHNNIIILILNILNFLLSTSLLIYQNHSINKSAASNNLPKHTYIRYLITSGVAACMTWNIMLIFVLFSFFIADVFDNLLGNHSSISHVGGGWLWMFMICILPYPTLLTFIEAPLRSAILTEIGIQILICSIFLGVITCLFSSQSQNRNKRQKIIYCILSFIPFINIFAVKKLFKLKKKKLSNLFKRKEHKK